MTDRPSSNPDAPTVLGGTAPLRRGDVPERIGPYRVLREIGEGGMGIVYQAEQDEPVRRTVALKLIKWGMDTAEVIARFDSERQALAVMNHPNIARVIEAGATREGRPYFAMEYVEGRPITEYCDEHRLTVRERLRLFVDVCDGVQHAHQKGIIHRDLKPSNVLVATVDGKPVPKIIDFGVAKATSQRLTEQTLFTAFGQLIGTPEYMSPEQAEMSTTDIDTRTDVYSLGVLLYELLAGRQPFDARELRRAGLAEIQRVLREEDPPKPSSRVGVPGDDTTASASHRRADRRSLERTLRGDLDWITMKALEKDRERRYETAHALALDIERHLSDEPVLAGPPAATYRLRKLFRRHRTTAIASAAVAIALVGGAIGTTWGWVRARAAERVAAAEAAEATRQSAIATATYTFLAEDLLMAVAPTGGAGRGRTVTMREVLDVAADRLQRDTAAGGRFADEPLVEAYVRAAIGNTYRTLGEYGAAEPHLVRSLELRRGAIAGDAWNTAHALNGLGLLRWSQGRLTDAEPLYREAYEMGMRLGPDDEATMMAEMNLATLFRSQGRYKEAAPLMERNLEAKRRMLGPEAQGTLDAVSNLANLYQETGDPARAEQLRRPNLDVRRRVAGEKAPGTISDLNNLANDVALQGRFEEAKALNVRTLALKQEVLGPEHPSTLNTLNNIAEVYDLTGRDAEAEAMHQRALAGRLKVLGPAHPRTLHSEERLAAVLERRGQFADAVRRASAALEVAQAKLGDDHPVTLALRNTHALALVGLGQPARAEALLRQLLEAIAAREARGEVAGDAEGVKQDASLYLGMALAAQRRFADAEPTLVEGTSGKPRVGAEAQRATAFMARFYDDWQRAQPDPSRAAKAAEWKAKLAGQTTRVTTPAAGAGLR
jgi:serine/threonine protein kinase